LDGWVKEEKATALPKTFNSPLATNPSWSPSITDRSLKDLPTLNFGMRIKQRFARSPGNPFEPPAPFFIRAAPNSSSSTKVSSHDSYTIQGKGSNVGDGFKGIYPGSVMADHDVSSADIEVSSVLGHH